MAPGIPTPIGRQWSDIGLFSRGAVWSDLGRLGIESIGPGAAHVPGQESAGLYNFG